MPEIIISGNEGRIEGRYHHAERKNAPAALILHPHPQHGGTMNNKVVYNMYQTFAHNGFSVLRINFRGVGRSEGVFDNGIGELCDAATALDWLQLQNQDAASFWIGGFSFGAWVAMQLLMRRPEIEQFITISPPANKYDFTFLAPCPAPGLIIQGDKDSIVDEDSVAKLAEKLSKQRKTKVEYHVVGGADHFFRKTEQQDPMQEMVEIIQDYINKYKTTNARPRPVKRDRRRRQTPII